MRVGVTSWRVSLPIHTSIRPSAASREDWRRSARSLPVGGPGGGSSMGVSVGTGGDAEAGDEAGDKAGDEELGDASGPSPGPHPAASPASSGTLTAARMPGRTGQNFSSESRDGSTTSTV